MIKFLLDARTATDHFPGIGRYVTNLAQAMSGQLQAGEQLLLLRDTTAVSHWTLPPENDRIQYVNASVSPFSLAQQWQIPRLLRQQVAHLYHSPYYLMPYRSGLPTVLTFYDIIPHRFPAYVSRRARLLFQFTTRLALRAAKHVIAISEATRQDLLRYYPYPEGRVTAVPLAADPRFQPHTPARIDDVRHKYALPQRFAFYVGINKPHKNLLRLLQAWQRLEHKVMLVIGGAWDERYPETKAFVAQNMMEEYVKFIGRIPNDDLPILLSAATIFLFPSLYEGFGLPVIEAMACGTAVACARSSSLPEVGGNAALYFDPTSVPEIAAAAASLLQDDALRRQKEAAGLEQAGKFSWEKTARQTLTIYRNLTTF